jgi:hypothetical protein
MEVSTTNAKTVTVSTLTSDTYHHIPLVHEHWQIQNYNEEIENSNFKCTLIIINALLPVLSIPLHQGFPTFSTLEHN